MLLAQQVSVMETWIRLSEHFIANFLKTGHLDGGQHEVSEFEKNFSKLMGHI